MLVDNKIQDAGVPNTPLSTVSSRGVTLSPLPANDDLAGDQISPQPPPRPGANKRNILKIIFIILLVLLIVIGGLLAVINMLARQKESPTQLSNAEVFDNQQIQLSGLGSGQELSLVGTRSLTVNGDLVSNGTLTISPSGQPSNATPGQIYFDENTNELAYFNGSEFISVGQSVTTLQGQTGNITLVAGPGMAIDGTTLSNTGVTSVGDQTGDITIGPGLTAADGTLQNSGIISATGGSGITVTNDGAGNITITNSGAGSGTVNSPDGTTGRIAKFTGAQTIADSIIFESGSTVTVNGSLSVTSDLTLGTALTVGNGGTGNTSLATNGVVLGNGSGALTAVTAGAAGQCFMSTAGAPAFQACPGSGGVTTLNGLSGALTVANASAGGSTITINDASTSQKGIAQFDATNFSASGGVINTIQNINSGASPSFVNLTLSGDLAVNGNDVTSTGALNITPTGALSLGSNSQATTLQGNASTIISATNSGNTTTVSFVTPTANTTIRVPALSAGTYDICTSSGNCSGASVTLQGAYDNSTSPEITLDTTRGALTLRDNATPLGANLLEVQNNAGSTTYFAVTSGGSATTGSVSATSNINSSGGALQTASTSRVDNSGNLVNIGNLTATGAITIASSGAGNDIIINGADILDVQDAATFAAAATFNGLTTFNTDVDFTLAETENISITNTVTGTNSLDLISGVLTNNTSSGTQRGALLQNAAGSGSTEALLVIDNADTDTALVAGLQITAAAGTVTTAIDLTDADIDTALNVGANNILGTTGNLDFTNFDVIGSNGNVTAGTYNGQTISSAASFTGTLAVAGNTTLTGDLAVNGGDITSSGALNITPGGALTIGTTGQILTLQGTSGTTITATSGANTTTLGFAAPTANTTLSLPALAAGTYTVCTSSGNCAGAGVSLQSAYNNSTSPEITLDATRGALTLRDSSGGLGANLFEVQNNAGGTTYFAVTAGGTSVTGSASATGNINSGGGSLQTAGTTRVDNSGNLTNIGSFTNSGTTTLQGGTLTIGTTSQPGTTTFHDGDGETVTLQTGDATSDRTITLGNESGTICLQGSINCGFAAASGSTSYIQNQTAADQTANFRISGTGRINTALISPAWRPITNSTTALSIQNAAGSSTVVSIDTTNSRVGFGGSFAPEETVDVVGNLIVKDAASDTKSLRMRTNGIGVDLEGAAAPLILSVWQDAAYATTQYHYLTMESSAHVAQATGSWQFRTVDKATTRHTIDGTAGTNVAFNQNGEATNFTIQGDTDTTLFFVQGSTDRIGIGTNTPGYKLDVAGDINSQATLRTGTSSVAGGLVISDGSSNTGTLTVAALGQDTTYTLPDPGGASVSICLTTGNCAGAGGGVTGSGTNNRITKFTSTGSTVGNSTISDDGTTVTTSVDVIVQGGDLTVGTTSQLASLLLHDGNGQTTTLQAGNSGSDLTFILPTGTGSANQCLKQSGTGNQLFWDNCDGGGGGVSATLQTAYNNGISGIITTTDNRDIDIVLADTSTDANLDLVVADGSTGFVSFSRANGSGTADPAQMLLVDNLDTNRALPTGIKLQAAAGGITTAIDATDAEIVDAISVAGNNIVGTTGNIDFTNFDVVGATGNITAGTFNGQTISSAASFTGTLAVAGNTTLTGDLAVNGGDITSGGGLNVTPTGALTLGSTAQAATLQGNTSTTVKATDSGNTTTLGFTTPTANTTLNLPALSAGTYEVCTSNGNCAGAGVTLQAAYNNSSSPEVTLDATRGALTIRDASSPLGANLLEVQNNAGSTTYFAVTASGTSTTGTLSATGNINSSGGTIQTASTNRIDNSGNLVNIGNLTATGAITIASSGAGNDIIINGADILDVQDAATFASTAAFNGVATFNTDVDFTLAETENVSTTNTVTGSNSLDLISGVLTNNTSSGTQRGAVLQNAAGSGSTEALLTLDNADTDTALVAGLQITAAAGGITTALDVSDSDIVTALSVGANDIVGTTGNLDFTNFDVLGSSGNVTAGTYNGQTISSAASFTGTVAVSGNTTLTGDLAVNGGDITSSGALNITPGGLLTVGATTQNLTLQGAAGTTLTATSGSSTTTLAFTSPTANTTLNLPALSAGTYEICTSSGNCAGAGVTLQTAYNNSTSPEITVDATRGAVTIRDASSALGANLFEVQNNAGSTTYLAVTASGISVGGTIAATSNINSSGGAIQTGGTTRIDNSGNLTNIGTLSLSGAISGGTTYSGSGNINTTGGVLQTNSTTRVDNSGNLTNIGNITATGATTIASTGAGNDITIDGADQFIVQDAAMFNAAATFNSDIDITLAETENVSFTNTVTGSNSLDLLSALLTNNTSSGTQRGLVLQNTAGSGTTESLVLLDNADTDTSLTTGLQITSAAGGIATGIDLTDTDIVDALNAGANNIVGTTGNLDFTNFDVVGASGNTTVGGTLTVSDALTSLTGDSGSGDALNVSNSTSTGNIALFKDGSTSVVTVADNGLVTFKATTDVDDVFQILDTDGVTQFLAADSSSNLLITDVSLSVGASLSASSMTIDNTANLNGNVVVENFFNSATALQVSNSGVVDVMLTVDTSARNASGGNLVKIGNSTGTDTGTTFLILDGTTTDPSTNVSALNGGMFYDSDDHKVKLIENGLIKVICNTTDLGCGTGTVTLQSAYNNGNTINTTSGNNIAFNLTEQATDPSFLIDLQCDTSCSTNGKFAVQDDGSDVFTILPAAGGITMGSSSLNTALTLNSGTGTISIGTGAEARTINFGTGAAVIQTINIGGTGANVIAIGNTQTGGSIALGAAMTTGTITIGGTGAQTGTINIGTGTGVQALNFGTGGTGAKTVTIGSTATSSVTNIQGDGGTANGDINIGDQTTAGKILDLGSVTNAGTGTVNIATATGAAQTVNIGSTAASSVLSLNAGSGSATFNATSGSITIQTTTTGQINIKPGGSSNIVLGTSDTTGTLLVLDDKTGSGDPTGVSGGMYYNSNLKVFRCYDTYWRDCMATARTTLSYTAEMGSGSGDHMFTFDANSSGGTDDSVGGATGHPSVINMGTGGGANNWVYAGSRNTSSNVIRLGNGDYWRYETVIRIPTISDDTNDFIVRAGFIDNVTDGTDGCFFKYNDDVNTNRWQGFCTSGGSSTTCDTASTSTTQVAQNTWYRLTVTVNSAGTSANFSVDGSTSNGSGQCQVTTNIPTGSGNLTSWGDVVYQTLGGTSRTIDIDYIDLEGQMGTSR